MLRSTKIGAACTLLIAGFCTANAANNHSPVNLAGNPENPFSVPAKARVFLFVRTDCPVTNRYAPELQRLADEFANRGVTFWLIYPDPAETPASIKNHIAQYHFPGEALRDPQHDLVKRAEATVAPEAAVFNTAGRLVYHGRIDDRWVDFGKARPEAHTHDLENAISAVLSDRPVTEPVTRAIGCSLADVK